MRGDEYRGPVRRVAVAGGIGAGKSAVGARLAALGYAVIDADEIARAVVAKGEPAWIALRDAFGSAVLGEDGEIDRRFLADVVFHDESALRRLNSITHGYIGEAIAAELDGAEGRAAFVLLPLYRPEHRAAFHLDEVWAILVSPDTALERLRTQRGYEETDARARLDAQMTNEERLALADRAIWNEGTIEDLYGQLDAALVESGLA